MGMSTHQCMGEQHHREASAIQRKDDGLSTKMKDVYSDW